MKALLLHNPKAGEGDWPAERLLDMLRGVGVEAGYRSVKEEGWQAATREGAQLVVVAGGDGTVEKVAVALRGLDKALAILPTGGANNVARWLGIPAAPQEAVRGLASVETLPLHLARVRCAEAECYIVEAVGIGALARADDQGPQRTRAEKLRRGRDALRAALRKAQPIKGRVTFDGKLLHQPALMIEVMNVGMIGPNLALAPGYAPSDPLLALAWLPLEARDAMLDWLDDPQVGAPPLRQERLRRLVLEVPGEPLRIGDQSGCCVAGPVLIERDKSPLRVLVPRPHP